MRAAMGIINSTSAKPDREVCHFTTLFCGVELPKDVGDAPEIN